MKSIKTKFIVLIMAAVLLCAAAVGGTGIIHIKELTDRSSAQILNLACQKESNKLDVQLKNMKQSVDTVAYHALQLTNLLEDFQSSSARETYLKEIEPMLVGAASSTQGAVAVYLHFNPEIAPSALGLFYSMDSSQGQLEKQPSMDLALCEDREKAPWYYKAEEAGKPIWLEPYNNGQIAEDIISYVIPLYKGDMLIGIVGMDILFSDMAKVISEIKVYDTGYAYLMDKNNKVLYHPNAEYIGLVQEKTDKWDNFEKYQQQYNDLEELYEYEIDGEPKKMVFFTLENGMNLIVTAPSSEIDNQQTIAVRDMVVSVMIISVLCIVVTIVYTQSIVRPLRELTEISKEIAGGNLRVNLSVRSNDEVGELTHNLQQTVECLRVYMDRMNDIAYTDTLTGVKSRTAYDEEIRKLNNSIQMGFDQFGVVMFDINGLKSINDTYGHEAGNMYIINGCRLICNVFKHSPVFRIGGDEFIVILIGEDLLNSSKLLEIFYEKMEERCKNGEKAEDRVTIAAGMAHYNEETDSEYQDVFKRADEAMYEKKKAMKQKAKMESNI